jgi:hypothetical protein
MVRIVHTDTQTIRTTPDCPQEAALMELSTASGTAWRGTGTVLGSEGSTP